VLGLPGFYARQAQRAGVLGLIGFVLTIAAAAYHLYLLLYEATATPLLAQDPGTQVLIGPGGPMTHGAGALGPLSFALLLGWPVFGLATVRAGSCHGGRAGCRCSPSRPRSSAWPSSSACRTHSPSSRHRRSSQWA
jgi:hypothetical protein